MLKYPTTSFAAILIQKNVWLEKKKIYHMLQLLIIESCLLHRQHVNESMMKFIQQCCQDYQDSSKTILDSLLNWSKRVIRLDCLVVKDNNNDHILITDLDTIKKTTTHYFQNIAGSYHTSKDYTNE